MFFHSLEFVLVFLPISVLGYYLIEKFFSFDNLKNWYLCFISLVFYFLLGFEFFIVLLISLIGNFLISNILQYFFDKKQDNISGSLLFLGFAFNLGLLGYFKYRNFFAEIIFPFTSGETFVFEQLIFPIGISFYTFIQMDYLLDIRAGISKTTKSLARHTVFAAFFPYVTAGPLILSREILPQMDAKNRKFDFDLLIIGFSFFSIGLVKKLLIADPLYPYVNEVFTSASFSEQIGMIAAWLGALGYTLQLYLPINFNSPLKASSISEFWRRWHITMTRFFTNYVFTPLSVKNMRTSIGCGYGKNIMFWYSFAWPIILTFAAAGIWHGAGWNFLIFGLLHGIALSAQRAWQIFGFPKIPHYLGNILVIVFFTITLVFFDHQV